MVGWWSQCC